MRLYAARPTSAYGTALDSRQLAVLRRRFPTAELADPAKLWTSNEAWLGEWPEVLTQLDLLALWAGEDGQLGAGVLRELADAVTARLPIVALDPEGRLCHFGGFERGWGLYVPRRRVGQLLYGPRVARAELAAFCRTHRA